VKRSTAKVGLVVGALTLVAVAVGMKVATSPSMPNEVAPAEPPTEAKTPVPESKIVPHRQPTIDASVPPTPVPAKKKSEKAAPTKHKALAEPELMERLRKAQDTDDYVLSLDLAREGLRRFPDSPDAPEMAAMVVKSLAREGKVSEARAEAEVMVNKYAGTSWAREVERHTGAHPHVNQVPPP
jgi:hypothetical protein